MTEPHFPAPSGLPIPGSLLVFRGNSFQTLLGWHRCYGSAEHLRDPLMPPRWVPTPGNLAFKRVIRCLDDLVYGLIRERRDSGARHDEVLSKRLYARDPDIGLAIDDRQIRDEVLTVFTAGHETTAVGLSPVWYLLASYRAARDRLHANIHRHAGFWDDPDALRPERFLFGQPAPGHRLAYMPCGAGPRVCPGNDFTMGEGVLLLATVARYYRLDLLPGQAVEPEITLKGVGG